VLMIRLFLDANELIRDYLVIVQRAQEDIHEIDRDHVKMEKRSLTTSAETTVETQN
jgi:hypothetical protein